MPVSPEHRDLDAWLTGKAGVELLRSAPDDILRMWPVSTRVNKSGVGDDDGGLIEPVEDVANAVVSQFEIRPLAFLRVVPTPVLC